MSPSLRAALVLPLLAALSVPLAATEVSWPTTMDRSKLTGPQDYLQPTISGRIESGSFGMVREEGRRFQVLAPVIRGRADVAATIEDSVHLADLHGLRRTSQIVLASPQGGPREIRWTFRRTGPRQIGRAHV